MPSGACCPRATLRGKGGTRSPASRRRAASASSIASTSSDVVVGFRMSTAWRKTRGRARRRRSITTRSVTWAAVGVPTISQCCARRESLAAWARGGCRGWYVQSWKCWATHTGESPTRARISLFTSSYLSTAVVGRLKNARWDSPVRRGASAWAQSSGSHPSVVAVFSNICKYASTSSWTVIFGRSWVACTRGSGNGTRWRAAVQRAAISWSA